MMATIKSYSDLQQSKVLATILPIESADMCWQYQKDRWVGEPDYKEFPQFEHAIDKRDIPCWSLAALLSVLPVIEYSKPIIALDDNYITYPLSDLNTKADNPVDACVAMIEKLHELKML